MAIAITVSENIITADVTSDPIDVTISETINTVTLTYPGPQGAQGDSGVVAVTSPITNTGTSGSAVIGINQSLLSIAGSQVTSAVGTATYAVTAGTATWADATDIIEQYCKAGTAIAKGNVVYVTGATGSNVIIGLAQANGEATSSKVLGFSRQTLALNDFGYVITEGLLEGIDTSGATAGDPVWLSPTTPGGFVFGLANKPSAPNNMVYLGVVVRANQNNGVIFVRVQNGFELEELHNVKINGIANNDIIRYDSTQSLWINSPTAPLAGTATYATTAGTATYATTAGSATYATTSGTSVYATTSGTATYATNAGAATTAGTATYATTAGTSTYATTSGTATYATTSGTATYAMSSGTAVYATTAGGAPPTGSAGGDFTGTYPNPTIATGVIGTAAIASTLYGLVASIQALGTAAAGTSATVARADHVHPTTGLALLTTLDDLISQQSTFIDIFPRYALATSTISSGQTRFGFFTPTRNLTITTITVVCATGGTDSGGTSIRRLGLFTVSGSTVTLVARTANDATIGNTSATAYARTFDTTGGYPSSYSLTAGTRYAIGMFCYNTGGTYNAPTMSVNNSASATAAALTPRISGATSGNTEMPTTATTVSDTSIALYGRLS